MVFVTHFPGDAEVAGLDDFLSPQLRNVDSVVCKVLGVGGGVGGLVMFLK